MKKKQTKTKICSKCGKRKLKSGFYQNPDSIDGLRSACRICEADYKRKRNKRKDLYGKSVRINSSYEQVHRIRRGAKQKLCIRCKKWKPYSGYNQFSSSKDGMGQLCRICATVKARIWYKKHRLNKKAAGKKRK